jgi:hypothetical protein
VGYLIANGLSVDNVNVREQRVESVILPGDLVKLGKGLCRGFRPERDRRACERARAPDMIIVWMSWTPRDLSMVFNARCVDPESTADANTSCQWAPTPTFFRGTTASAIDP